VSETVAGLRPVEERPHGFPVLTLLIVLIPLIALGVWLLAKGLQLNVQPAAPEPVAARAPAPLPVVAPVIVVQTNVIVAVPPPVTAPVYKLQGVYWRPAKPSAVINGKTVYIGDRVENARVAAIDQESATITVNGERKVLLLP
jgi:hypothetical protein